MWPSRDGSYHFRHLLIGSDSKDPDDIVFTWWKRCPMAMGPMGYPSRNNGISSYNRSKSRRGSGCGLWRGRDESSHSTKSMTSGSRTGNGLFHLCSSSSNIRIVIWSIYYPISWFIFILGLQSVSFLSTDSMPGTVLRALHLLTQLLLRVTP